MSSFWLRVHIIHSFSFVLLFPLFFIFSLLSLEPSIYLVFDKLLSNKRRQRKASLTSGRHNRSQGVRTLATSMPLNLPFCDTVFLHILWGMYFPHPCWSERCFVLHMCYIVFNKWLPFLMCLHSKLWNQTGVMTFSELSITPSSLSQASAYFLLRSVHFCMSYFIAPFYHHCWPFGHSLFMRSLVLPHRDPKLSPSPENRSLEFLYTWSSLLLWPQPTQMANLLDPNPHNL